MLTLVAFVALALGVSFLCSVLEAVLLSVSPSFVAAETAKGHRNGRLWQRYKDDVDRPLAAILSLNTIAHTVGAAGAGAQAAKVFGEAYFGVISAVLTLLILVFSEIIPKTIGALYWRQLAPLSAQLLRLVITAMLPLVLASQALTRLLSRNAPKNSMERHEFAALADLAAKEGVLSEDEARQLASILRFRQLRARDVMTPRPVIFALEETLTASAAVAQLSTRPFSRIPLYRDDSDNIDGFVRKDDILATASQQPQAMLRSLRRPLLAIPDTQPLDQLLRDMVHHQNQIALVVNEYGSPLGLLTTEDLIETLLGLEIVDETDRSTDMQALARQLWRQRAASLGLALGDSPEQ